MMEAQHIVRPLGFSEPKILEFNHGHCQVRARCYLSSLKSDGDTEAEAIANWNALFYKGPKSFDQPPPRSKDAPL